MRWLSKRGCQEQLGLRLLDSSLLSPRANPPMIFPSIQKFWGRCDRASGPLAFTRAARERADDERRYRINSKRGQRALFLGGLVRFRTEFAPAATLNDSLLSKRRIKLRASPAHNDNRPR